MNAIPNTTARQLRSSTNTLLPDAVRQKMLAAAVGRFDGWVKALAKQMSSVHDYAEDRAQDVIWGAVLATQHNVVVLDGADGPMILRDDPDAADLMHDKSWSSLVSLTLADTIRREIDELPRTA